MEVNGCRYHTYCIVANHSIEWNWTRKNTACKLMHPLINKYALFNGNLVYLVAYISMLYAMPNLLIWFSSNALILFPAISVYVCRYIDDRVLVHRSTAITYVWHNFPFIISIKRYFIWIKSVDNLKWAWRFFFVIIFIVDAKCPNAK